jgi:hypothetical protein
LIPHGQGFDNSTMNGPRLVQPSAADLLATREPAADLSGLLDLRLLDEYQLAELLGLRVTVIRRRRAKRLPPTFIRIGHAVRYRVQDVRTFIENMQPNALPGTEQMVEGRW